MLRAQGGVEGFDEGEGGGFAVFQGVVDGLPLDVGAGLHQSADPGVLLEPESQADRRHRRYLHHDDSIMMLALSAARGEGRIQLRNS
jgi:hypothetical protein